MRKILAMAAVAGLMTAGAMANPWYARGEYNGWDTSAQLTDNGGGYFTTTLTGLTAGARFNYKIANADWSASAPGSDGRIIADAAGEISYHFWENTAWADGWMPASEMRVGYDDPGMFGWDLIGTLDGWTGTAMTAMGGGLYSIQLPLTAGPHEFKFREGGSWDISIGDNFGNSAANNTLTVDNNGDVWAFELDLPGGRWRTYLVPEPATMTLLALGALALVRRR